MGIKDKKLLISSNATIFRRFYQKISLHVKRLYKVDNRFLNEDINNPYCVDYYFSDFSRNYPGSIRGGFLTLAIGAIFGVGM
ncbi:MAG: hypothetical protein A3B66_07335 [Alphaproteobacteria bacterium RIFCSPHIGHO2_02_FULL_46_13]|nr:MAG: hypothetical protein A3B66_07335 [Alphaproteobacteria bacterium RIFCSPHIGHO2_02_FULL_46_13]